MNHFFIKAFTASMMLLVLGLSSPLQSKANTELRKPIQKAALVINKILQRRSTNSISVGEFSGPPSFGTSTGTGIRAMLIEELKKLNITAKTFGAPMGIKGEFRPHSLPGDGHTSLKIKFRLVDGNGEELSQFSSMVRADQGDDGGAPIVNPQIDNNNNPPKPVPPLYEDIKIDDGSFELENNDPMALAEALGANICMPISNPNDQWFGYRSTDIMKSFSNPQSLITPNGGVKPASHCPYSLEVWVNGSPRRIRLVDGYPFIDLNQGETFELRIRNDSPIDVSTEFFLDGISSFAISQLRKTSGPDRGAPKYTRWIVPKFSPFTVKGWHKNNSQVTEFKMTRAGDSVASKLGGSTRMGMISAIVKATWRPKMGERAPSDEPPKPMAAMMRTRSGVGEGDTKKQIVKEDISKREYGSIRAMITIRYEKKETKPAAAGGLAE